MLHPFWPIFLTHRQFTASEIGLLLSAQMATRIISPNLWSWLADTPGKRMAAIRLGSLLGFLFFAFILVADGFWSMLLVIAGYSFFWNAVMPQFEAMTLDYLNERPQFYSRIRLWGSVGFIAAVIVGGYWFQLRIEDFRYAGLAILLMIWVTTLWVATPKSFHGAEPTPSFLTVILQSKVLTFLLVSFLLQVAHGIYYAFYSLHLEEAGYPRFQVGLFWALSVVAEIGLFLVMHRILTNWSLRGIFLVSLLLTVLRWLLIAFFVDSLGVLLLAQGLHAFSFGACHAASIEYLRRFFLPPQRGRGQAIFTSVSFGAGGAIGALLGGLLWSHTATLTFSVAAAISLVALAVAYKGLER